MACLPLPQHIARAAWLGAGLAAGGSAPRNAESDG